MEENKYKDALERAKKWYNAPNADKIPTYANRILADVFPELGESEDEKVRKALIKGVESCKASGWTNFGNNVDIDVVIAWLERQKSVGEIVSRCKTSWYNEGKIAGQAECLTADERYWQGWHDALEKQSNPDTTKFISFDFNAFDSELQEASYYIPKGYSAEIKDDKVIIKKADKKQSPKFKVGDWIINKQGSAFLIAYIDEENQRYVFEIGGYSKEQMNYENIEFANTHYHLWSISDAKDGDVLAEESCIFIIQKLGDNNTAAKTYCTLYNDGDFDDGSILYFDIDSTKPATKEQCELLFRKMKEAGYEWDAGKKELKKLDNFAKFAVDCADKLVEKLKKKQQ